MGILGTVGELLARVHEVSIFDIDLVDHRHGVLDALFLLVANVDRPVVDEETSFDLAVELLVIGTYGKHRLVLQDYIAVRERDVPTWLQRIDPLLDVGRRNRKYATSVGVLNRDHALA